MKTPNVSLNKKAVGYAELFAVVLIWGCAPLFTLFAYEYYSSAIYSFFISVVSCVCLILLNAKKLRKINLKYFKIAVPTGLFYSCATLFQKIGLNYTTPTKYAFLENLTCVAVPIISFILIKKKPNIVTIIGCVTCLASSFVLCGVSSEGFSLGIGETLCASAGIFYGVNIAVTGAYAKDLDTKLYILIQHFVTLIVSLITAIALNFIRINGNPMEQLKFSFSIKPIAFVICYALISNTLCWLLRTASIKHLPSTVVAVIANFAAVVTSVTSVIAGKDELTLNLVFGVILGVASIILSSLGDVVDAKKAVSQNAKEQKFSDGETSSDE